MTYKQDEIPGFEDDVSYLDFSPDSGRHSRGSLALSESELMYRSIFEEEEEEQKEKSKNLLFDSRDLALFRRPRISHSPISSSSSRTLAANLTALAKIGEMTASLSSSLDLSSLSLRPSGTSSMEIIAKFGQLGSSAGMFNSPHGFCLGPSGEIVVADTNNHRIQVFDTEGNHQYSFGIAGKEDGYLWYPRKVAVLKRNSSSSSNNITTYYNNNSSSSKQYSFCFVICDRGGERSRMQIFTSHGIFLQRVQIRYIDIVAGLAVSREGHILAVDSVTPTIFVISENGVFLRHIECSEFMLEPSDIGVFGSEYYITDFKGHSIVVIHESGYLLHRIGSKDVTRFPNGIDISDQGDIVVGDSHGNQFHVTIYSRTGILLTQYICPHVKVSRCCGLKITSTGRVVTLAKNNHHVLVLDTLFVP